MPPRDQTVKRTASAESEAEQSAQESLVDVYFSADVETDGPIPGPFSMLSFALVYAARFDAVQFRRPPNFKEAIYAELKPISTQYKPEALQVNGLDRIACPAKEASPKL
jgi:hypothetical protein